MKMEQTECSETSAYKIQTPRNYPEESIQHSEHGKSLKSRILHLYREEIARHLSYLFAYEDGTECSETSEYKIQTAENYPEESIQHSEHGESLKSRILHLYREETARHPSYLFAYEDGTECSETSEYKIQTPRNYPEESSQHSEHGESLKSRILHLYREETARHPPYLSAYEDRTECSETSAYKIQTAENYTEESI